MSFFRNNTEEKQSLLPSKIAHCSNNSDGEDQAAYYGTSNASFSILSSSTHPSASVQPTSTIHNLSHECLEPITKMVGSGSDPQDLVANMEEHISQIETGYMSPVASDEKKPGELQNSVTTRLKFCKISPIASQIIVYGLLPVIGWAVVLLVVGQDNLPGGTVFVLVLLEFGGRLLGYLVSLLHMPPMVGMLGLGLAVRNLPYLDLTQHWSPSVSAPIRQIALAIILTRAGFGLDLNTLVKFKWLILRLAVGPTILEAMSIAVVTHLLLGFPWVWGILVGFVVAAVSPAVIVPRILELKAQGYGEKKGIPTVVLAAASLDNVVAISLFGVALGFVFTSNKGTVEMILQCPLEVLSGCGFGLVWGLFSALIFNPSKLIDSPNADESVVKGLFVLSGGVISIFGFKLVNYSGAGALGCIVSAFITITVWKARGFHEAEINQIKWGLTFMWKFFEPLLFGLIGCQITIADLEGYTVLLSVACLVIGAVVRFVVTYGTVCYAGLNMKEKLFIAISWIPKATVQAAIGPTALEYARNSSSPDKALEQLAMQVLTIAVVVILLTALIGEFAVIFTGPKFLAKGKDNEVYADVSNHNHAPNDSSQVT